MYTCKFKTNIDCCKKFMSYVSGRYMSPNVGDLVEVYKDSGLQLFLKVVERNWVTDNGGNTILECELHLPPWIENIPQLEKILKSNQA